MNISNQSSSLISSIGETVATFYAMGLQPLQVLIMTTVRYAEHGLPRGQHIYAHKVRATIDDLYKSRGGKPASRQLFWLHLRDLQQRKLIYIAPPKKGSSHRSLCLTTIGSDLFTYPKSINPYQPQPITTP
jgi:hypothetical protein